MGGLGGPDIGLSKGSREEETERQESPVHLWVSLAIQYQSNRKRVMLEWVSLITQPEDGTKGMGECECTVSIK